MEYGIVAWGALTSLGIPARTLHLKTQDVETRESGAGHVTLEAYLPDQKRWAFADGQFGAVPLLNGEPISGVRLQRALAENDPGLQIAGAEDEQEYRRWIAPYLYYFDVHVDNRCSERPRNRDRLMLVPLGAPEPKLFQRVQPLEYLTYTSALNAFYPVPTIL